MIRIARMMIVPIAAIITKAGIIIKISIVVLFLLYIFLSCVMILLYMIKNVNILLKIFIKIFN